MNTKILNPNLDVVITATGKVKIVTEIGGKLVAVNDKKLQNKLLYTASKKPESWWIDANCYDHVYDENTGEGYLLLNPDVTELAGVFDMENGVAKNIFSNVNIFKEEPDIDVYSVVVPNQITALSNACFAVLHGHMQSDDDLANITLPETINSILTSAIACRNLINLTIYATTPPEIEPQSLNVALCYVPEEAFDVYTNNEGWSKSCLTIIPIGVELAKMYFTASTLPQSSWINENCILPLCVFDGNNNGYLAIKDGVTRLYGNESENIFNDNEGMYHVTSINIPSQITTIGQYSFVNCQALESVEIPESVTSIEDYAFNRCDALTSFVCKAITPPTLNGSHIFDNIGTTTCTVPNDTAVTNYQNSEWANYFTEFISQEDYSKLRYTATQKLDSPWITMNSTEHVYDATTQEGYIMLKPPLNTNMGYTSKIAYYDNFLDNWENVLFDYQTGIDTSSYLTTISIPPIVKVIGIAAFGYSTSLTTLYIPNSIRRIDKRCFRNCTSLNKIVCKCETPPELRDSGYEGGIFTNIGTDTCYVPANSITAYQNDAKWSSYFTNFLPIEE